MYVYEIKKEILKKIVTGKQVKCLFLKQKDKHLDI